jgi:hypothetical protein
VEDFLAFHPYSTAVRLVMSRKEERAIIQTSQGNHEVKSSEGVRKL